MASSDTVDGVKTPGTPIECISVSATVTTALGRRLADVMRPGDVILLSGPLGAGKTALVQGLAEGLGSTIRATSPTFVLVRDLGGRIPLRHADLYRLDRIQEVIDLDVDELLDADAVVAIEWGRAATEIVGDAYLSILLDYEGSEGKRSVVMELIGQDWSERASTIEEMTRSITTDRI